jgi:hypothetical protein
MCKKIIRGEYHRAYGTEYMDHELHSVRNFLNEFDGKRDMRFDTVTSLVLLRAIEDERRDGACYNMGPIYGEMTRKLIDSVRARGYYAVGKRDSDNLDGLDD